MNTLASLLRLWNTIRWLRPIQLWGRFWFRIYRPSPDLRPAPALRPAADKWVFAWRAPSMQSASSVVFLNRNGEVSEPGDWNNPDQSKLWLYNLHYFDDLNAVDADQRVGWHRNLVQRWIDENPPGIGNGWEPYPVSLRLVNWVKWSLRGSRLDSVAVDSLAVQARWLSSKMEYHLLGNHLWANAKALVFAGMFFEGPEAGQWLDKGLRILRRELEEQIMDDGGHFERSPMYHAILLEDILDLIQLYTIYPGVIDDSDASTWRQVATRMLRWMRVMTHPDGEIAFFNDAVSGIAANYADLRRYAETLKVPVDKTLLEPVEYLSNTGYVRIESGAAVLFMDVGEIGPDYLPGHAHADTLSIELSIHGKRILVNSGTSTYEANAERLRQRGTAAHSTITVDNEDSSEVWSGFRVARRARPFDVQIEMKDDTVEIEASHDGYCRLPGKVFHKRSVRVTARGLIVEDILSGNYQRASARYHLHPDVQSVKQADFIFDLAVNSTHQLKVSVHGADNCTLQPSTWHPEFGMNIGNQCMDLQFSGKRISTEFAWD